MNKILLVLLTVSSLINSNLHAAAGYSPGSPRQVNPSESPESTDGVQDPSAHPFHTTQDIQEIISGFSEDPRKSINTSKTTRRAALQNAALDYDRASEYRYKYY